MTSGVTSASDRRFATFALLLGLLALVRWLTLHVELPRLGSEAEPEPAPIAEPEPPPYTDEARRLLGGLAPGDALAVAFVLDRVEGPDADGAIRVVGIREGQRLSIWLRPHGADDRAPPLSTVRWDLFYDRAQPPEPAVSSADTRALLATIAERVEANE